MHANTVGTRHIARPNACPTRRHIHSPRTVKAIKEARETKVAKEARKVERVAKEAKP